MSGGHGTVDQGAGAEAVAGAHDGTERPAPDSARAGTSSRPDAARPDAGPALTPALPRWQPPRAAVRAVACPRCGAVAGSPCYGRRGKRVSHHAERVRVVLTT